MHAWDNALLVEQEARIREFLEQRGITDLDERQRVLIRITAAATIQSGMEQIYTQLLGSQMDALRTMNQHFAGAATDDVKHLFTARPGTLAR